ncbi:MAG: hypothetical protein P8I83_02805 [Paracoccaceae bacterium]|nr:hypothetical protein [Paracoccaceae bacterium]
MIVDAVDSTARKVSGAALQELILGKLVATFPEAKEAFSSCPMSAHGEDIRINKEFRKHVPISLECKYASKGFSSISNSLAQAHRQARSLGLVIPVQPLLFLQQGDERPMAVMEADTAIALLRSQYVASVEGMLNAYS